MDYQTGVNTILNNYDRNKIWTLQLFFSQKINYRKTLDAGPGSNSMVNDVCCRFNQLKVYGPNILTLDMFKLLKTKIRFVKNRVGPGSSIRCFTVFRSNRFAKTLINLIN
jgi:hypothetical protein